MTPTNAKVVCTLGPASDDRETVAALADAGMRVARLNASHGSRAARRDLLDLVQTVDRDRDHPIATMVDLQGPEIRTAAVEDAVHLETGSTVRLVEGADATPETVGLTVPLTGAAPGDRVLLDDGRIELSVTTVEDDAVSARVESGGDLGSRKGVNVPGVTLDLDAVTDRDREEVALAVDAGADFVAASFVRDGEDVLAVRGAVEAAGGDQPVIAKVERRGAAEQIESIVETAYGVMVARGDLGVEYPMEEVPLIQKRIVRRCQTAGVPVIVATEMLDSMVHARRPTRAEATDVANAVLDGADAVMLSAETAVGDHPVRVVEAMDRIVGVTETSDEYAELREDRLPAAGATHADALARAARTLAADLDAAAVATATESGYTARKVAKYRPPVPIVAATPDDEVRRRLALSWGVRPVRVERADEAGRLVETTADAALDEGVAASGDTVVVLSGMMSVTGADTTNTLKVHVAAETVATGQAVVAGQASGPVAHVDAGDEVDADGVPEGAVLALPTGFDATFEGDLGRIGAVVAAETGMTGYPAIIARELGVPMVSGAVLDLPDGAVVTVDGERGVVYRGDVRGPREAAQ
ncbi:MAG: pyruvate kinase [Haloarculaceae archaeon]